jgi:hypothetical protein
MTILANTSRCAPRAAQTTTPPISIVITPEPSATAGRIGVVMMQIGHREEQLSLLKNLSVGGVPSSETIERRDFRRTIDLFETCASQLQWVDNGCISLTQPSD